MWFQVYKLQSKECVTVLLHFKRRNTETRIRVLTSVPASNRLCNAADPVSDPSVEEYLAHPIFRDKTWYAKADIVNALMLHMDDIRMISTSKFEVVGTNAVSNTIARKRAVCMVKDNIQHR